ncbi:MAG: hypothetical protein R3C11_04990 [Planctomycetaceae bacterium]
MLSQYHRQVPVDAEYIFQLLHADYEIQRMLIPDWFAPHVIDRDTTIATWFAEREFEDLRPTEIISTLNRILQIQLDEQTWTLELQTAKNLYHLAQLLTPYVKKNRSSPACCCRNEMPESFCFFIS